VVSKIFFIHQLIRNHYVKWWSYWVLNLNEERNVVFEDHISFPDHHDTTEILLKMALNTIKQIGFFRLFYSDTLQE
jgi:hypothetical protein